MRDRTASPVSRTAVTDEPGLPAGGRTTGHTRGRHATLSGMVGMPRDQAEAFYQAHGYYLGHWEYGGASSIDLPREALLDFMSWPPGRCMRCEAPASLAVEGEMSGVGKYNYLIQPVCETHRDPPHTTWKHGGIVARVVEGAWVAAEA